MISSKSIFSRIIFLHAIALVITATAIAACVQPRAQRQPWIVAALVTWLVLLGFHAYMDTFAIPRGTSLRSIRPEAFYRRLKASMRAGSSPAIILSRIMCATDLFVAPMES